VGFASGVYLAPLISPPQATSGSEEHAYPGKLDPGYGADTVEEMSNVDMDVDDTSWDRFRMETGADSDCSVDTPQSSCESDNVIGYGKKKTNQQTMITLVIWN
jgi:hypothetical protein